MAYQKAWPEGWKDNEAGGTYIDAEHLNHMEEGIVNNDAAISNHTGSSANPHNVTKSQVGLGSVPNVATNDQTPTYTVASTLSALVSGEKLSVAMGKIAKGVSDLISHVGNSAIHKTTDTALSASSENPVQNKAVYAATKGILYDSAGAHNSIYRGKSLGTSVTSAQYAAISSGAFTDMYIGDYWTINGIVWRIAAFDYWYNVGDANCTTHHVVVVPDSSLYSAQMNTEHTTTGGYAGSAMRTANLESAKTTVNAAFSGHVMSHRVLICNGTSNGAPSGWAWYDSTVDLMSERMVYGAAAWGGFAGNGYQAASQDGQLPLFALRHDLIHTRYDYWLQDVVSAAYFARVYYGGLASSASAGNSYGVRPAVPIS